ncbi:MAG: tetratricopeptide repeat protein, partial [Bradymonadaceae bacterium]
LLRQVDGVEYRDAGEALHALVRDTESGQVWSETVASNAFDIAAVPVLRGFFDRGILQRRKGQHKHLAEALNEDEGGGRMHLLRGEEGVGKSRLLSEVKATTKLDGKLVLSVRCEKGMRAWELVHELFARLVELGEARDVEELDYYTPYLLVLERFSSLEGETTSQVTEAVDFDWIRRAFHDAIGALKPREVVMFIEDLHEGDIASRQFLADWFEGESRLDVPDMVVSTRDQRAVSTPFLAADRVELYDLDGLQRVDVRHFFRDRLELEDVPDDWLDRLADAADGRPAYLQEICRTLIEEGVLRRKTGRSWELDVEVLQDFALPDDVRGILRRRIDSAGASAREVLEFLVLAGRPVPWEWVRDHAASQDESLTEADRRLDALWRQDLVRMTLEVGGRYLQPANEELEDVVGDLMNPSWRRRIHRKLGEHLVGEWRRGDLDAAVAADQFEAGGREDEAARLYEAAGDRCWRRAEFGGAHDRYRAALEGTEETAAGAFLRLKLARVYLTLYEGWAMERALKKAGALAERTALDWVMYTTFLSAVGSSQAMGDDGAASEWLDRLADCLPTMSRQAAVLDRRSRLAWRSGDLEEARQLGERALRRARHFGERSQLTSILSSLGQLAHWSGDQRKSEERFQKALEVGGSGERTDRAAALYRYGTCLRRRGDERRAADRLQEALEILSRGHRPDLWIRALMEVSKCHAAAGSLDASRRYS